MKREILLLVLAAASLRAQTTPRFEEHLGATMPLSTRILDETGRPETLGALIDGKPTILWFRYLKCPQLCSVVADSTVASLRQLQASVGPDYSVVSVSIDPSDTLDMAVEAQAREVRQYGRREATQAWHVAVATPGAIAALTREAGFDYRFDFRSGQYVHPSGLLVLTQDGRICAYLTGVDFPARDIVKALANAKSGRIGPSSYQWVITCLEGGLPAGKYGALIWRVLWLSVLATLVVVFGGIGWMLASERKARTRTSP